MKQGFVFLFALISFARGDITYNLEQSGLTGGLIVHIGCTNWQEIVKLYKNKSFLVQGLDTDPKHVEAARKNILSRGLYGKVTVDLFNGKELPYIDNMVNMVIADKTGGVPLSEIMRVLVPRGIAIINGKKFIKPRPGNIDEWTHYLHNVDNNAVAQDTVVGPPRRLQWEAAPKWPRHHDKMSSISALVSSEGRIFYILDEGMTSSIFMPSHWSLIARDAFNGKLLWKKKIATWYSRFKGLKDGPADAPRRLVASGQRVYATLNLDGVLSCIDAQTGKTIRDYPESNGTEEILLSDNTLFLLIGPHSIGDGIRQVRPLEKRTIKAIDAESGKVRWAVTDVVAALTMALDKSKLYYFNFDDKKLKCLDRTTGKTLWMSSPLPCPARQTSYFGSKLVVHDDVVLFAGGEISGITKSGGGATRSDTLTALSTENGKTLWTAPHPPSGYSSPENLFVINETAWCDSSSNGKLDGTVIGYDLKTGAVKNKFAEDETNYWFHHRCYPGRATTNYIMTSRTGIEFINLEKKHWDLNHWTRGACLYGIMPCNGLIYAPPAPCICYAETYLHSFNAFAPAPRNGMKIVEVSPLKRLEKGPAYDQSITGKTGNSMGVNTDKSITGGATGNSWPAYRHDNLRSGFTPHPVPSSSMKENWKLHMGGKLSSVTIADNKVFVSAIDQQTIYAVDAKTGKRIWHYTTGGRVDSPPTYFEGRLLFGSADGYMYCLRANDGALIWRFLAALNNRRLLSYEQIESLWPVHGSIMIENGIAYFVAGRSLFVDGGMRFYRVNARTGRLISTTVLDNRNPKTGNNIQELIKWLNMPVGRPDILSCDGKRIYMRSQAFDLKGKRLRIGPRLNGAREGTQQGGPQTHLFCPTGYLDDTWFHRTYWLYGSTWGSGWCGYYVSGKFAPAGKIMTVGKDLVYVFGREPKYYRWTTPLEFRLFAAHKIWKKAPPSRQKPSNKQKQITGKKPKRQRKPVGPVAYNNNYKWTRKVPILVRAMLLAGKTLFIAGPPDVFDEKRNAMFQEKSILAQEAAWNGKSGAILWAISADTGEKTGEYRLASPPVFDGMAAADGKLFLTTIDGTLISLESAQK